MQGGCLYIVYLFSESSSEFSSDSDTDAEAGSGKKPSKKSKTDKNNDKNGLPSNTNKSYIALNFKLLPYLLPYFTYSFVLFHKMNSKKITTRPTRFVRCIFDRSDSFLDFI